MAKFASPQKQADSVVKTLQKNGIIRSLGTARNYAQSLTRVGEFVKENNIPSLRELSVNQANQYLAIRGEEVGQKTLDMERQAIQAMFIHLTAKLESHEKLTAKSEKEQILAGRAYSKEQIQLISQHQKESNRLSTEIAAAAGLRAHELLTLRSPEDRPADQRPALDSKWLGREGEIYTVKGKGGLVREVLIPSQLAKQLENVRLDTSNKILDRGIYHAQYFAINGGNKWSASFTSAANRSLGWSAGGHGVRHTYAQERMKELQTKGLSRSLALETVSQEMGHFRPEITEVYLR